MKMDWIGKKPRGKTYLGHVNYWLNKAGPQLETKENKGTRTHT